MGEARFAPGKTAVRWIEDEDIISDIDALAARCRITRSAWIRNAVRNQIACETGKSADFFTDPPIE